MKKIEFLSDFKIITNIEKGNAKIDYRFKIIYAIAMICVIADHLRGKGSIELNIQGWFNYSSFHMPLFMFSAGYFFKSKNIRQLFNYIKKKFKRLILPLYGYNIFYGLIIQCMEKLGFKHIRNFNFAIIFLEPLAGSGFHFIGPAWFSSNLFFVEVYNILKRKFIFLLTNKINEFEPIYLAFDMLMSFISVIISNKGYNKNFINIRILRFMHLNIYYELGIFYCKHLECLINQIPNDFYFLSIFSVKLCFHVFYSKSPVFFYGKSEYYGYNAFTVIIISILGILFWLRIANNLEPILGTNFYINNIADNTFSIMMNHLFVIDCIEYIFFLISKTTQYCKDFDSIKFYSFDLKYIYIPNQVLQIGIFYFLNCLFIPIIIQKIINKFKKIIKFY